MCEECKEWTLKRVLDCLFLGVSKGVIVFCNKNLVEMTVWFGIPFQLEPSICKASRDYSSSQKRKILVKPNLIFEKISSLIITTQRENFVQCREMAP